MKTFWQPANITAVKEQGDKTIIQITLDGCHKEDILRYAIDGKIKAELRVDDGRRRTLDQNAKFHATIQDICEYTGHTMDYTKELLKVWFCVQNDILPFKTSECSVEVMRELISFVIEIALENDIPLTQNAVERTDDIYRYLSMTLRLKKCSVCGKEALVYTMPDKSKISLCNSHYDTAKVKGLPEFEKLYKVYPIKILEG